MMQIRHKEIYTICEESDVSASYANEETSERYANRQR